MASFQNNNKDIRKAICQGQTCWWWVLRLGRWCREGQGSEPDVAFPENRHVRSLGLSGAPSLALQPKWSHWAWHLTWIWHLAGDPKSRLGPRPERREEYTGQFFPHGGNWGPEASAGGTAENGRGSVTESDWTRFQFEGLSMMALYVTRDPREGFCVPGSPKLSESCGSHFCLIMEHWSLDWSFLKYIHCFSLK